MFFVPPDQGFLLLSTSYGGEAIFSHWHNCARILYTQFLLHSQQIVETKQVTNSSGNANIIIYYRVHLKKNTKSPVISHQHMSLQISYSFKLVAMKAQTLHSFISKDSYDFFKTLIVYILFCFPIFFLFHSLV